MECRFRFVEVGKTVLASLTPAATNKTTKDQAATKKAEGSKPSGGTAEEEKRAYGYIGEDAAAKEAEASVNHPEWVKEKILQQKPTVD
jgi:hypothetical protein